MFQPSYRNHFLELRDIPKVKFQDLQPVGKKVFLVIAYADRKSNNFFVSLCFISVFDSSLPANDKYPSYMLLPYVFVKARLCAHSQNWSDLAIISTQFLI